MIKKQLTSLLASNERAPDLEKMERHEFVVDVDQEQRMKAANRAKADEVTCRKHATRPANCVTGEG